MLEIRSNTYTLYNYVYPQNKSAKRFLFSLFDTYTVQKFTKGSIRVPKQFGLYPKSRINFRLSIMSWMTSSMYSSVD